MTKHVPAGKLSSMPGAAPAPRVPGTTSCRIGRTYKFEAAHHLPLVPDGHRCKRMHGHNYRIEVIIAGPLDERGFVRDFAEIDAEVQPLIKQVDHRVLNDVEGLENPTAEVIAAWFIERIAGCQTVRVYENDDSWAEVSR